MNKKQKAFNNDAIDRVVKARLEFLKEQEEWKKKSPSEKRKIKKALKEKEASDEKKKAERREKEKKIYNQEKSNENFKFWIWIFFIVLFYYILFS